MADWANLITAASSTPVKCAEPPSFSAFTPSMCLSHALAASFLGSVGVADDANAGRTG